MAFPVVQARNTSRESSNTNSHTVSLPTGIESGNLLLVFFTTDGSIHTVTWPSGWTQLFTETLGGVRFSAAYRQAGGTEDSTITVTTSQSENSAHSTLRITGHELPSTQAPEATTAAGSDDSPNPPSLTPTGGTKDYLWIAGEGNDDNDTTTAAPTNYTNLNTIATAGGGACNVATAERSLNASSEDPGTFTLSASEQWVASTVAIHPIPNKPPTVALNSPADEATGVSTTPTLEFTGTDPDGDDIRYNVQVDTKSTFDTIASDTLYLRVGNATDPTSARSLSTTAGTTTTTINSGVVGSSFVLFEDWATDDYGNKTILAGDWTLTVRMRLDPNEDTYPDESQWRWKLYKREGTTNTLLGTSSASATFNNTTFNQKSLTISGVAEQVLASGDDIFIEIEVSDAASDSAFEIELENSTNQCTLTFPDLAGEAVLLDKVSGTDAGFANITTPADTDPFNSGDKVGYTVQSALTASTTYYWRVKGKDPTGSDTFGAWSDTRSFTVTSGVSTPSPNVSDSITITEDSPVLINQLYVNVNDGLTITEDSTVLITNLPVNVDDQIAIEESSNLNLGTVPPLNTDTFEELTITQDSSVLINNLVPTASDTVTITEDSIVRATVYVDTSDTLTITEDSTVQVNAVEPRNISVNDEISLSEAVSAILTSFISKDDEIVLTEDVTVFIPTLYVSIDDSITISESPTIEVGSSPPLNVDIYDDVIVSEDVSVFINQLVPTAFDIVTITESLTLVINILYLGVLDELLVTEQTTVLINFLNILASDEITVSEDLTVTIGALPAFEINVSDEITIEDVLPFVHSEEIIVTDDSTVVIIGTKSIEVSDDIDITDNSTVLIPTLTLEVSDEITITESVNVEVSVATLDLSVNDDITITEDIVVRLGSHLSVSDEVSITEDVTVTIPTLILSVNDQITIDDSPTIEVGASPPVNIDVFDNVTVSEDTSVVINELFLNVFDTVDITEDIQIVIPTMFIDVDDEITLTENVSVFIPTLVVGVSDSITLTEDSQVNTQIYVSVNDTLTITDNSAVEISTVPALTINTNDTITLSEDSAVFITSYGISVSDSVTVSENVNLTVSDPQITATENITLSESVSLDTPISVQASEEISVNESVNINTEELHIHIEETIIISEKGKLSILPWYLEKLPDWHEKFISDWFSVVIVSWKVKLATGWYKKVKKNWYRLKG